MTAADIHALIERALAADERGQAMSKALAVLTELRADIAKLEEQFSAAERERDALREALQQIANSNGPRAAEYRSIARAALEAKPE